MKKIFSVIVALAMMCSLFLFASCDNSDASTDTTQEEGTGEQGEGTGGQGEGTGEQGKGTGGQGEGTGGQGGFVNPGDNLGGGKEGTVPTPIESENIQQAIIDAAAIDLTSVIADTDSEGATVLSETTDTVNIGESGSYILSGNYPGGICFTQKEITVHLFLNNATIGNSDGIAINGKDYKKLKITVTAVSGTNNTITNDGDDVNAIHIKGTFTVNGNGSLTIESKSKGCIKATKTVTVVSTALSLTAEGNAIAAESFYAKDCSITVTSEKDGLHTECDFDNEDGEEYEFTTESGFVALNNVQYNVTCYGDGIQADTFVYINKGTYTINTNGVFVANTVANKEEYDMTDDDFRYKKSGAAYQKVASDYNGRGTMYGLAQSCKGIKVGEIEYDSDGDDEDDKIVSTGNYAIVIEDGEFILNTTDDAIHANAGYVFIVGGDYEIETSDDAITADLLSSVKGGEIEIISCYEGLEGAYVEISGGEIDITASDDGINAASDDETVETYIIISGGKVTVNATGDGVDSNGCFLISGGELTVYGPTSSADTGMDSEKGIVIQGGTVIVSSSLGMVETPASNSTQYVVSFATQTAIAADTELSVLDSDQNVIMTFTTQKVCQSIIFSSSYFVENGTYTIQSDSETLATFTVNSTITSIGSTGTGGMGGGMGGGGLTPPGGNLDPNQQGGGGMNPPDKPSENLAPSTQQIS